MVMVTRIFPRQVIRRFFSFLFFLFPLLPCIYCCYKVCDKFWMDIDRMGSCMGNISNRAIGGLGFIMQSVVRERHFILLLKDCV